MSEYCPAEDVLSLLFRSLDSKGSGFITKSDLLDPLKKSGLFTDDPRLKELLRATRSLSKADKIDLQSFKKIVQYCGTLVEHALTGRLIIPDFSDFKDQLESIFESSGKKLDGHLADYIPQLSRVDPEKYALSICSIDGQRASWGDSSDFFCAQSSCKPILYGMALEENGPEIVHQHVGREPSGASFNELTLNRDLLPHNPLINAGAIMCCSLVQSAMDSADRFEYVLQKFTALTGGKRPGFNNSVYLSEKQTADRNFALGHFMREKRAFPENTDLHGVLDFYFQCCSIDVNTEMMSVVAATLANAGICPITEERVFSPETVKCCLSMMYSCGMYDFSGEFAFTVGLPAKSGVSGILMLVVPNVMGLAVWSPLINHSGNSVKGLEVCKQLIARYNFHNYDSLVQSSKKIDPRRSAQDKDQHEAHALIWAASIGDLHKIKQLIATGADLNTADYDGRTAMHLAASEGRLEVIKLFIEHGVKLFPVDRWGNTPLQDAIRERREEVISLLTSLKDTPHQEN